MRTKELWFSSKQFPISPGVDIRVTWEIAQDQIGGFISPDASGGYLNLHPFTFVKVVQEFYGADKALDFAKIFLRDNVDNLAERYFKPLFDKIDRKHYGSINKKFDKLYQNAQSKIDAENSRSDR